MKALFIVMMASIAAIAQAEMAAKAPVEKTAPSMPTLTMPNFSESFQYQNIERRSLNVPMPVMGLPSELTAVPQAAFAPTMDPAQIEDILNKQVEALEAYMNARIKAMEEMFARNEFKRDMMSQYELKQLNDMKASKETALARMQARRDEMVKAMQNMMTPAAPAETPEAQEKKGAAPAKTY